jgi:hypothetical protein
MICRIFSLLVFVGILPFCISICMYVHIASAAFQTEQLYLTLMVNREPEGNIYSTNQKALNIFHQLVFLTIHLLVSHGSLSASADGSIYFF